MHKSPLCISAGVLKNAGGGQKKVKLFFRIRAYGLRCEYIVGLQTFHRRLADLASPVGSQKVVCAQTNGWC